MNLNTLAWDPSLIDAMGVETAMLAEITPSIDPAGWGTTQKDSPFADQIKICGNLGDQQRSQEVARAGSMCSSISIRTRRAPWRTGFKSSRCLSTSFATPSKR